MPTSLRSYSSENTLAFTPGNYRQSIIPKPAWVCCDYYFYHKHATNNKRTKQTIQVQHNLLNCQPVIGQIGKNTVKWSVY